ncbi:signal peptide peptidase SppA [Caldovatus aquaticus]|uniref:Signal peptide peptidase SppA n=1 Tax=Caldovatus aquaticus TaxID=2865671 RepID=A0ABS7F727_9PROT|nr:signal peptide peptidase SppA [Caldovatus aquaticus]MBW8270610.1 signal peptide peptidase SppA [Caldovatus aquaticus]
MSLEADLLIDRRRLKRRLAFWRVAAVLLGVLALFAVFGPGEGVPGGAVLGRGHVARLPVSGFISDDRRTIEALDRAARDDAVRALIVSIDSPGGSVAGGEALHAAIARFRAHGKPVVAVMGGTAASAGLMVAMAAERVLAREATLTGSIGVLLQSFDASELLARLGVRPETLVSGRFKNQPSPFQPLSEEGRAQLMRVVADMHEQFVAIVAQGRNLPLERVREIADGRVFTGRQALALGLVDAIGGEREARRWLAAERGVPEETPVRALDVRSGGERLLEWVVRSVTKTLVSEWLAVDAPRALWQPLP